MRILIDLHTLSPDGRGRGSGRYITELVSALQNYLPEHSIEIAETDPKGEYDVVHYPFFDFFSPTLPLRHPAPAVVTIHDVIPLQYPAFYPKGVRGSLMWKRQQWALTRVAHIITDAQASVPAIAQHTGASKESITAIPLAIGSVFHAPAGQQRLEEVRREYRLPKRFVLYVGDANWNKNVRMLLDAASELGVDVVLVGGIWRKMAGLHAEEISLRDILTSFGSAPWLHRIGQVPDTDLIYLYRLAEVLVQPSRAEGFSFPVLEALHVGCPVIASDIPAHHDLAHDSVVYFDPSDPGILVEKMKSVLTASSVKRKEIIAKGLARAKFFSWEKTVRLTREVYAKAARGK